MDASAVRYDRWKAPADDGGMLIWPEPQTLLRQTLENRLHLSTSDAARIQGVPLPEVRRSFRRWLGHAEDEKPLVATGHQAELYHPGVWVKNALIGAAAAKLGGSAFHFAVDTDAPKHLTLRWPGGAMPLSDSPAESAKWSGLLDAPAPAHLDAVAREVERAAAGWDFVPLVGQFLASMRRLALESMKLPPALTNSTHELDWKLGLRHHLLLDSPLCWSEPYLVFVHHVLARASAFAADYNAALESYREENKIRSPGRPMPDLACRPESCEVPFWLDDLAAGTRARATVARDGPGFELRPAGGDAFRFDAAADGWDAAARLLHWLRRNQLRLSPRALTLTAVLRLLVADQFVHGIGGGQYDQVLDRLITRHFGFAPPRFSVTTATLFFPTATSQERVCLPCFAQEGHRLRHSALGPAKMQMVQAIGALPRRSPQRQALFYQMHGQLAVAGEPILRRWEQEYEEAEHIHRRQRLLFDRELFYAIQPAHRLQAMIDRYRDAF